MTTIKNYQRVWADIDLDAMLLNMNNMKANIAKDTQMIGVIKTDGYGHGAVPIARELEKLDYVWGYATATFEEANLLKKAGMQKNMLILGYTFPYCYEQLAILGIRPATFRYDMLEELSMAAKKAGKTIKIHIKVDTGMSRIGIMPNDEGLLFVKKALETDGIEIEGIFTHFAKADELDKTGAWEQYRKFSTFVSRIEDELGYRVPIVHCSNSAGIIELKDVNRDIVRAGITLYGLWPSNEVSKEIVSLKPLLSLKSHVVYIKTIKAGTQVSYGGTFEAKQDTKVATIPVGYGDGYPRGLSNKGWVLIRGQKAPILGRVCMDQFMVDVSDIEGVSMGDVVTLIGTDGTENISMEQLGDLSGRFNYELACDLGKRIPRVYYKDGQIVDQIDYFA